jgi:UDP-N-acetylglucosamine 2-epimerase (non-hydrolysing)
MGLPRKVGWATQSGPKPGGTLRKSRIALIVGTRPEAIKLSPVAHAFAALGEAPMLFVTGQHAGLELADHDLAGFPAIALACPGQIDPMLHADLVRGAVRRLLPTPSPELIVVQGDTSSALGGALAAHEAGIPLAHVEAGLRTHDSNQPWPEEQNRVTIDRLSDILFAPTSSNASNLRREQVGGQILITGNSGIDALARLVGPLPPKPKRRWWPKSTFNLLVTCHRRENWLAGLDHLAHALCRLVEHGVRSNLLLPPNPRVTARMTRLVGGVAGIRLSPPLSHAATIQAMREADRVLSDSGGMQEESPALGVPMLILRDKTERPEGLANGTMELVGTDRDRIVERVLHLRRHKAALKDMRRPFLPFGDGQAAPRIARHCLEFLDEKADAPESLSA